MPTQKDLKRLVRSRMKKTGEAYTAARLQLLKKNEPTPDYAEVAGMSDASVSKQDRPHVGGMGPRARRGARTPKNLIARSPHTCRRSARPTGGRRWSPSGTSAFAVCARRDSVAAEAYEASKSRTFNVPVRRLFDAFANTRTRRRVAPGEDRRAVVQSRETHANRMGR